MNLVDITKFTQEQLWGIQYARQLWNEGEFGELIGKRDPLTTQEFADFALQQLANQKYAELIAKKEKMILEMARQLPQETIDGLLAQFNVPPVIKDAQ